MKIVVDKGIKSFEEIATTINGFEEIEFLYLETKEITNDSLQEAEAVFVRSTTKVDKTLLENTQIKIVGSATAGMDHIDLEYLKKENIKWFCTPGSNSWSVVNYVMSSVCHLNEEKLFDLKNKIGIVGYGHIGKKLKVVLDTLSIPCFVYDPFLDHDFLCNINEIKDCDLISLHIPLTYKNSYPTFKLVDKLFLDDIADKILINTSRGGVVDEDYLLESNKVNYISDVWINEPTPSREIIDYALLSTPHIAGHSHNGKINSTIDLIKYLQKILKINDGLQSKNNLKIEKFYEVINLLESFSINAYYSEYQIDIESSEFKRNYLNANNDPKKTFEKCRYNHSFRKDIEI